MRHSTEGAIICRAREDKKLFQKSTTLVLIVATEIGFIEIKFLTFFYRKFLSCTNTIHTYFF